MNRLTDLTKKEISNLSRSGLSLREIQKITKIPLSTLQYNLNRKNGRKREKEIKIPESDFLKGEIIGAFAGDGSYNYKDNGRGRKHLIRFTLSYDKDKEYKDYLMSLMEKFNLKPYLCFKRDKSKNIIAFDIRTISVQFINFIKENLFWDERSRSINQNKNSKIKTYSVCLKKEINNYSLEFLLGFIRGVMDTDGFVNGNKIGCGVVSEKLIQNLKDIFTKIKINYKIRILDRPPNRKNLFILTIKEKLKEYYSYIGFSNLRKERELMKILKNEAARI